MIYCRTREFYVRTRSLVTCALGRAILTTPDRTSQSTVWCCGNATLRPFGNIVLRVSEELGTIWNIVCVRYVDVNAPRTGNGIRRSEEIECVLGRLKIEFGEFRLRKWLSYDKWNFTDFDWIINGNNLHLWVWFVWKVENNMDFHMIHRKLIDVLLVSKLFFGILRTSA